MAQAYTPGLRVTKSTLITKDRRLPLPGELLVEVGGKVKAEDVVARTHLPGNVRSINVANRLGVHPTDVGSCMLKKEGEAVAAEEVIASTKSFFGLFKPKCTTPVKGTIESISSVTGQVLVREDPIPVEMKAYLDGKIIEVLPKEGVVVQTQGAFIQGIFGIGGETYGTIQILVNDPSKVLDESYIDASCKDKILIGGSLMTEGAIKKAVSVGARAIVAGGLNAQDLKSILGYDIGVAITGSEEIGLTLIVTEGFGQIAMAQRTFELLKSHQGSKASVNGTTQIRAGVMRPEVIISLHDAKPEDETTQNDLGLAEGGIIRIIREPNFGKLGKVIALPAQLEIMESETKVRILRAKLIDSGEEVTIPRANVEIIQN